MSISLSSIAMAQSIEDTVAPVLVSSNIEKVIDGKNFSISPNVVGKITDEELKAISQQANGTGDIIISNVIEGTNQISPFSQNTVTPSAWYDTHIIWDITKQVTQRDTPLAAQQITSVGQSQERTINTTYKLSANVSASVTIPSSLKTSIEAGLASEITQSINTKYSGPKVGSGIVSYVFWITPFENRGTWNATGKGNFSGDISGPYSGSWQEPNKFVEWTQAIK
ncbi:hypothetical protein [Paenibacillus taichungensis]|uniref:hypothetical protein n=1 Tax=Paenibacillus taichungensis TaxID=484184 RepID=UPI0038D033DF